MKSLCTLLDEDRSSSGSPLPTNEKDMPPPIANSQLSQFDDNVCPFTNDDDSSDYHTPTLEYGEPTLETDDDVLDFLITEDITDEDAAIGRYFDELDIFDKTLYNPEFLPSKVDNILYDDIDNDIGKVFSEFYNVIFWL